MQETKRVIECDVTERARGKELRFQNGCHQLPPKMKKKYANAPRCSPIQSAANNVRVSGLAVCVSAALFHSAGAEIASA